MAPYSLISALYRELGTIWDITLTYSMVTLIFLLPQRSQRSLRIYSKTCLSVCPNLTPTLLQLHNDTGYVVEIPQCIYLVYP
jgi:hypothetical protein